MFIIESRCPASTDPKWFLLAKFLNHGEARGRARSLFKWLTQREQFGPRKEYRLLEVIDTSTVEEKS